MQSKLKETLLKIYGEIGQDWLLRLPDLLAKLEKQWQFSIITEFPNLSYHYVLKVCLSNGERVVLKCGVPNCELTTEIAALKHFDGKAAIRLLKADAELGAILLEEAVPGETLNKINNEDEAIIIFSSLMRQLHHSTSDTNEPWLAIDPKGVLGEREYEVGAFMRNPIPRLVTEMNTKQVLSRRLDLLTELTGFDRKRLWGWSFSQAVLAAIWCLEDTGNGYEAFIQCAKILKNMAYPGGFVE